MRFRDNADKIDQKIYETLTSLGVPVRMLGYRYMDAALRILMQNEEAAYAITKMVYQAVALQYEVSSKQVESAIRTAVKWAWHNGNKKKHESVFGYSRNTGKKPCSSEFLLRALAQMKYSL